MPRKTARNKKENYKTQLSPIKIADNKLKISKNMKKKYKKRIYQLEELPSLILKGNNIDFGIDDIFVKKMFEQRRKTKQKVVFHH